MKYPFSLLLVALLICSGCTSLRQTGQEPSPLPDLGFWLPAHSWHYNLPQGRWSKADVTHGSGAFQYARYHSSAEHLRTQEAGWFRHSPDFTVESLLEAFRETLETGKADYSFTVLEYAPDDLTVEWTVRKGDAHRPLEHEIQRLKAGSDGIYALAIASDSAFWTHHRTRYIELIRSARLDTNQPESVRVEYASYDIQDRQLLDEIVQLSRSNRDQSTINDRLWALIEGRSPDVQLELDSHEGDNQTAKAESRSLRIRIGAMEPDRRWIPFMLTRPLSKVTPPPLPNPTIDLHRNPDAELQVASHSRDGGPPLDPHDHSYWGDQQPLPVARSGSRPIWQAAGPQYPREEREMWSHRMPLNTPQVQWDIIRHGRRDVLRVATIHLHTEEQSDRDLNRPPPALPNSHFRSPL